MTPLQSLLAAAILSLSVSCASTPLPPRLTKTQAQRLAELPLPETVGVVPYKHPVYSDHLAAALAEAEIFLRVDPIESFSEAPDWVATVEKSVHGSAVIPALTFATAGVVPTIVEEDHGFIFSLAPVSQPGQKTLVDASYSGTTTLGWVGLAFRASPNFTGSEPLSSERFRKLLSYRTLSALRPEEP